jgi:hypothetical protein
MSYKILCLAENLYKKTGAKAKIAFPVGGAHGYVSELLKLPKEKLKELIDEVMKNIAEKSSKEDFEAMSKWNQTIPHFKRKKNRWDHIEDISID